MKKFIIYNIIFFLPIVILGLLCEILLRNIPNEYSFKKNYLDHNSKNVEILILGNSHAYYGLNPKYFTLNSFNAANTSQTLPYDFKIFETYNKRLDSLKYIVLPIDNFLLYFDLKSSVESWRVKNYELYFDLHLSDDFTDESEILTNNADINGRKLLKYYLFNISSKVYSDLGWGESYKSINSQNLTLSGETAAKRHTAHTNNYLANNVAILTRLVKLAESRKVKVILYISPAFKTYVKYSDKTQLNNTINVLKLLSQKHHNVSYYNFFTDQSFTSTDFYDADHFNEIGAKKFSIKMDRIVTLLGSD